MVFKVALSLLICSFYSVVSNTFKDKQLEYPRVRQAYEDKNDNVVKLLKINDLYRNSLNIYLRAFKKEKQIELWGKNESDEKFKLIKTYEICRSSGKIGPKRKQGDMQVPEGFYHIDRFNPSSNFYLSLGINYPNTSDKKLGFKSNLGGDIFIHGACVTVGCLPITDDQIKELYIFCVEARNNGQTAIPVSIFPSKLNDVEFKRLTEKYGADKDKIGLWSDLKLGFDLFNTTKKLPKIGFLDTGRHSVN